MREFGAPIGKERREALVALVARVYDSGMVKRTVTAGDLAIEDEPERIAVREVEVRWGGDRLRVGRSEATARPPIEWLYEVSSDVGEADYFKHYLVREHDIVLAQRKVLTVIDEAEAATLEADLAAARWALGS